MSADVIGTTARFSIAIDIASACSDCMRFVRSPALPSSRHSRERGNDGR
ncbi:hypothetical protein [Lysobacter gummosus]